MEASWPDVAVGALVAAAAAAAAAWKVYGYGGPPPGPADNDDDDDDDAPPPPPPTTAEFFATATPPADLAAVSQANESVHYHLAGGDFGPSSGVDLVLVEVNEREMQRYVPRDSDRKGHVFAEISAPTKSLLFDVLVHEVERAVPVHVLPR